MKNKILATLVAFGLVGSVSAIEINDNLSINGFIDTSYTQAKLYDNASAASAKAATFGIDEVELDFILLTGNVQGELHLDTEDSDNDTALDIEQVKLSYSLDNGLTFTIGRYGSSLGLEREDPTSLSTFSRAYDGVAIFGENYNLGNVDGYSVEGIAVAYQGEGFTINASIDESNDANLESDDLDYEISLSYTGIDNLTAFVGYRENSSDVAGGSDTEVLNLHASYQMGKTLLAAEFLNIDNNVANGGEDAFMLMANHAISDKLSATLRFSEVEVTNLLDVQAITIAPSYQISDNLGAILEYTEYDLSNTTVDGELLAVELTYTF